MKRGLRALTAALMVAGCVGVVACDRLDGRGDATAGAGSAIDDAVTAARVRSAFDRDAVLKGRAILVESRQGTVRLRGALDEPAQVDHAVLLARGVKGVRGVDNQLTVAR